MELPIENQRIRQIIDFYFNGNENQFCKAIDISQPRINRLFSLDKRSNKYPVVSFDIIQAIINKFININPEWLITGKGSMLKNESSEINLQEVEETKIKYISHKKNSKENQIIPLYNITASAGIVTLFADSDRYVPIDYISIPNLPKSDGALYVTGDSMYPLLKSGDIVIYKQYTTAIENIFWGEMYLISIDVDGDISTFVKWIHKSKLGDEYICLVSQNQHHQPKDIHISTIKALAIVKASIRINSMN